MSRQELPPNVVSVDPTETERLEETRRKLFYFPSARKVRVREVQIIGTTANKPNQTAVLYARYFGKRNLRDINLEKIPYRVGILEASLTAQQANTLVELITDRSILDLFSVLELRALVGTTTLALLDRDKVISVRAVEPGAIGERQSGYQETLREIVGGYGFRDASRINYVPLVEKFDDPAYIGQIAIVHPDPDNLKTSQGMLISNLVPRLLNTFSLVAVAGPPKMFPIIVPGSEAEYIKLDDLDRARVAIFKSPLGEEKARERAKVSPDKLKLKVGKAVSESEWLPNLKKFLEELLPKFGIKPEEVPKFLSEEPIKKLGKSPMQVWREVFTHESIDSVANYENWEQFGDSVLKAFFTIYLHKQVPGLIKRTATELHQQYMSKFRQPDYADQLGLGERDHYRIRVKNPHEFRKSKEDLLEAFTAAIFELSDLLLSTGQGERKVLRMLDLIFEDKVLYNWQDIVKKELSQPRTQLKQRVDKIYMREDHRVFPLGNTINVEIFIKGHEAIPLLREYGINLPSNRIVTYSMPGTDEGKAITEAYEEGLRYMDSIGMTEKRLTEINKILKSVDPAVADLRDEILNAKSLLNLEAMYFLTSNTTCITRLYGVKKGKKREHFNLAQISTCNGNQSKHDVMEKWLRNVLA
jgi:dsRNA-specific ribonuclease